MQTGKIKKLVTERGFGFITAGDGQDVFFHFSVCRTQSGVPDPKTFEKLNIGDLVEYDLERNANASGLRASFVTPKAGQQPRCVICERILVDTATARVTGKNICMDCVAAVKKLEPVCARQS